MNFGTVHIAIVPWSKDDDSPGIQSVTLDTRPLDIYGNGIPKEPCYQQKLVEALGEKINQETEGVV